MRVSSPQYGVGIRVEGNAKLAGLTGETQGIYIRLTMQEKADVTVDNLGLRALAMSGDSVIRGKITGADASSSFIMQDSARIAGDINVGDSKVNGKVNCTGNVISGIFNNNVICSGEIQGGIFYGNVENNGTITGGIFYGTVSGNGIIGESAKVAVVFDTDGGSAVDTQKILRGQKAAAPASPTKTGSVFCSWTVSGAVFDFTAPIIRDTTLTATWTICDHSASTVKPSCTQAAVCTVCKEKYSEPLGHSYGEPVYTWNGTSCTAERVCGRDASHTETETVTALAVVTQQPTCTLDGLSTYTAVFTNAAFAAETKENVKTAEKLGHSFEVLQQNKTQHWNKCSRCDETDGRKNHTGGTAACNAQAECAVCHVKYGEPDAGNHRGLEKVDEIPATAAEAGTREHWRCNACGKLFADADGKHEITSLETNLWKLMPSIIEGMNGKWSKGREDGLTFRSDAAYDDFIAVLVDGAVISADNYTTRAGSIIVELKANYLASLTEGEHTIAIRSASGDAVTGFTVGAKLFAPRTGSADMRAWMLAAAAALVISCVTIAVLVERKRKIAEVD